MQERLVPYFTSLIQNSANNRICGMWIEWQSRAISAGNLQWTPRPVGHPLTWNQCLEKCSWTCKLQLAFPLPKAGLKVRSIGGQHSIKLSVLICQFKTIKERFCRRVYKKKLYQMTFLHIFFSLIVLLPRDPKSLISLAPKAGTETRWRYSTE